MILTLGLFLIYFCYLIYPNISIYLKRILIILLILSLTFSNHLNNLTLFEGLIIINH